MQQLLTLCLSVGARGTNLLSPSVLVQKYRHHDEDSSPQDQSSPQLTEEAGGPELVQVAEKNLSQVENVHGYVTHAHISPMKVGAPPVLSLAPADRLQTGTLLFKL